MSYRPRTLDAQLDELLHVAPAVAIEGPKGVGKTATARRRAASAWMLDDEDQRALLSADLSFSRNAQGTTLIDEWQKLPQVWDAVRRRVDDQAPAGSFLLTGSATPASHQGTHSGAGRILSLRMRPMALYEGQIVGIEVKLSASVNSSDVKHLLWLKEQFKDDVADLVIVTTGIYAYRRQDGVAVVPLALLGA